MSTITEIQHRSWSSWKREFWKLDDQSANVKIVALNIFERILRMTLGSLAAWTGRRIFYADTIIDQKRITHFEQTQNSVIAARIEELVGKLNGLGKNLKFNAPKANDRKEQVSNEPVRLNRRLDELVAKPEEPGKTKAGQKEAEPANPMQENIFLTSDESLRLFYEKKGLVTGLEALQVDLDSLGMDLTEEGQIHCLMGWSKNGGLLTETQTITLRKVAEEVIAEMNKQFQSGICSVSTKNLTKNHRYFVVDTTVNPFKPYVRLGSEPGIFLSEEQEKQLWLYRILKALVDKGHLFKIDRIDRHGYFIQA